MARWRQEYKQQHAADDTEYVRHLESWLEPCKVEDGEEQAAATQAQIKDLDRQVREEEARANQRVDIEGENLDLSQKLEFYKLAQQMKIDLAVLCLKRDSLGSGVALPLDQFVKAVLSYRGDKAPSMERLMMAVSDIVEDIERGYLFAVDIDEIPVSTVVVGKKQIRGFINNLAGQQNSRAYNYANQRWESIQHLFYAMSYLDHPLFTGVHQQTGYGN